MLRVTVASYTTSKKNLGSDTFSSVTTLECPEDLWLSYALSRLTRLLIVFSEFRYQTTFTPLNILPTSFSVDRDSEGFHGPWHKANSL